MEEQSINEQVYYEWVQQVQYLDKLLNQLEENLKTIMELKENLLKLEDVKKDDESLIPIANGIFIEAKITNPKKLRVNIGKGIVVEKTINETIALVEKQEKEIILSRNEVTAKLEELYSMMQGQ